jgi:hypothetical protein
VQPTALFPDQGRFNDQERSLGQLRRRISRTRAVFLAPPGRGVGPASDKTRHYVNFQRSRQGPNRPLAAIVTLWVDLCLRFLQTSLLGMPSRQTTYLFLANSEFAVISIHASRTNCLIPSIFQFSNAATKFKPGYLKANVFSLTR